MFAAAMLYSTPALELSIYSTCKRISQKLMRNVTKFLDLIYKATGAAAMHVIRSNMEEVVIQGPDGCHDVRVVNSYPSKVRLACLRWSCVSVLLRHSPRMPSDRWKFCIRYASASACSASRASSSQRRSDLMSCEISRTRRRKAATGMAGTSALRLRLCLGRTSGWGSSSPSLISTT